MQISRKKFLGGIYTDREFLIFFGSVFVLGLLVGALWSNWFRDQGLPDLASVPVAKPMPADNAGTDVCDSARFQCVMNNEAVLDKETRLTWERKPFSRERIARRAALDCRQLATGGRYGWRLPSLQELQTLIDPSRKGPSLPRGELALPLDHPFSGIKNGPYWTTTKTVPWEDESSPEQHQLYPGTVVGLYFGATGKQFETLHPYELSPAPLPKKAYRICVRIGGTATSS